MMSFQGFRQPKQNWFKLPNEWINVMSEIKSISELKVIMYVLRHTWGYGEYDTPKCISVEEFTNGRKKKDGTRTDKGTGLSDRSVQRGLQEALDHGYLQVEIDDKDKGRIKKYYNLRMKDDEPRLSAKDDKVSPGGENVSPRSKKDTYRKTPSTRYTRREVRPSFLNNKQEKESGLDKFISNCAKKLRTKILEQNPNILKAINNKKIRSKLLVDESRIRKEIVKLFEVVTYPSDEVKKLLYWYVNYYEMKYVPKIYKGDDLIKYIDKIKEIKAIYDEKGDYEIDLRELNRDLINKCWEVLVQQGWRRHGEPPNQETLDEVLVELGYNSGELDVNLL